MPPSLPEWELSQCFNLKNKRKQRQRKTTKQDGENTGDLSCHMSEQPQIYSIWAALPRDPNTLLFLQRQNTWKTHRTIPWEALGCFSVVSLLPAPDVTLFECQRYYIHYFPCQNSEQGTTKFPQTAGAPRLSPPLQQFPAQPLWTF